MLFAKSGGPQKQIRPLLTAQIDPVPVRLGEARG